MAQASLGAQSGRAHGLAKELHRLLSRGVTVRRVDDVELVDIEPLSPSNACNFCEGPTRMGTMMPASAASVAPRRDVSSQGSATIVLTGGPSLAGGGVRAAAGAGAPNPFPATTSARVEALFVPRPRGRVHRQGKARAPYEFGVKASIVTTNGRAPGGQFVLHAKALPGNPYDGHTLGAVIVATEKLIGCAIERGYLDKGYRGHNAAVPAPSLPLLGQKRGVFGVIKRELRRRSAIEAVIGHMKNEGHLGRCWLKGREGHAANVVISAVGYNFRLILAWLRTFLRLILNALIQALGPPSALKSAYY